MDNMLHPTFLILILIFGFDIYVIQTLLWPPKHPFQQAMTGVLIPDMCWWTSAVDVEKLQRIVSLEFFFLSGVVNKINLRNISKFPYRKT